MDTKTPFVAIIFPNLNGGDFIFKNVDAILDMDYPLERFELIIVDNNSSDGSVAKLKDRYTCPLRAGRLRLIELASNVGAPAAYNAGMRNARPDYAYILKMDNDMILERTCVKELVGFAETHPGAGIVGGKVFYYSDPKRIHLIGSRMSSLFGGGIGIGKYELDEGQFDKDFELDAVNGCLMLVRRRLIKKVGLMDEQYFLYFDDLDWTLRARTAGFRSFYCHKAKALHNTSQPAKRFTSKVWLKYAVRNGFYFARRRYSGLKRAFFIIAIHTKIAKYAICVMFNNPLAKQGKLFEVLFRSYVEGVGLLWKSV